MEVVLTSDALAVTCHPEHGFTISSIRCTTSGTEFLWQSGALPRALDGDMGPSGAASCEFFDREVLLGGWFTMFPNAGLPSEVGEQWMHGEAPRLPWKVLRSQGSSVTCEVTTGSGFQLVRTADLTENRVSVTTIALNSGTQAQPVTFGEHPCFSRTAFSTGTIVFDDSRLPMRVPVDPDGPEQHVSGTTTGRAGIRSALTGNSVELTFDRTIYPEALLWTKFTSRTPLADVIAIEPHSGSGLGWDAAVSAGRVRVIEPGEHVTYGLSASFSSGSELAT